MVRDDLTALIGGDVDGQLVDAALAAAHVADSEGRGPADPGYVETIDLYWAAAELCQLLALSAAAQPTERQLSRITSEATTMEWSGGSTPDWAALSAAYRRLSPLSAGGIGVIRLTGEGSGFRPRSSGVAW